MNTEITNLIKSEIEEKYYFMLTCSTPWPMLSGSEKVDKKNLGSRKNLQHQSITIVSNSVITGHVNYKREK